MARASGRWGRAECRGGAPGAADVGAMTVALVTLAVIVVAGLAVVTVGLVRRGRAGPAGSARGAGSGAAGSGAAGSGAAGPGATGPGAAGSGAAGPGTTGPGAASGPGPGFGPGSGFGLGSGPGEDRDARVAPGRLPADLAAQHGGLVLLQFSSAFCSSCRDTRGLLADVAAELPGLVHRDVDLASRPELVRLLGLHRTPTTLLVDGRGRELLRVSGVPRRAALVSAIAPHLPAPPDPRG